MSEKIIKTLIEKILNKKIHNFSISTGSNPGDGYLSTLYSVDVEFHENNEIDNLSEQKLLPLLFKCYPSHPIRQEILNVTNIVTKELEIYRTWIPALRKFYKEFGHEGQAELLPFVPYFGGETVIFDDTVHIVNGKMKIFHPLDNFIVMGDVRKLHGYKMADRLLPFDFDHYKLVLEAQATFHASSWVYKQKYGLTTLSEKFPQLKYHFYNEKGVGMFQSLFRNGTKLCLQILRNKLGNNSPLVKATEEFEPMGPEIIDTYFKGYLVDDSMAKKNSFLRIPAETNPTEQPWVTITHGDAWANQVLFRYDPKTKRPCQVVFVDFQLCHESCPTMDIVFFCYLSTDYNFRKKYMDALLNLYYDRFTEICKMFQVDPLPGFTVDELKRRCQISKGFATAVSLWGFPLVLNRPENQENLDSVSNGEEEEGKLRDVADMINSQSGALLKDEDFCRRLIDNVQEFYEEGII